MTAFGRLLLRDNNVEKYPGLVGQGPHCFLDSALACATRIVRSS